MIIEFKEVSKSYNQGKESIPVLEEVNLKIKGPGLKLILGPSGSGKSTLINLGSLMKEPSRGEILIDDIETSGLEGWEKSNIRRQRIGVILQRNNLFPFLNLLENVMVPINQGDKNYAYELLQKTGIKKPETCPKDITQLEEQKVTLARALINSPSLILADEPTGELNKDDSGNYLELLRELTPKVAVLVVSNNSGIKEYFDEVYQLEDGILHI